MPGPIWPFGDSRMLHDMAAQGTAEADARAPQEQQYMDELAQAHAARAPERTQEILSLGEQAGPAYAGEPLPAMARAMTQEQLAALTLRQYLQQFGFMRGQR